MLQKNVRTETVAFLNFESTCILGDWAIIRNFELNLIVFTVLKSHC